MLLCLTVIIVLLPIHGKECSTQFNAARQVTRFEQSDWLEVS